MTRSGYNAYCMYIAMQRHFNSSYDYFKYNGKVNATPDSYKKRSDYFSFEKLANIVSEEEFVDFFLAHFLTNTKTYIRGMSKAAYDVYKEKIKNLHKKFESDLQVIYNEGFADAFRVSKGQMPRIIEMAIAETVCMETLVLIDGMYPFIDRFASEVDVPFVFPQYIMKLQKYRPFLVNRINVTSFRDIARKTLLG